MLKNSSYLIKVWLPMRKSGISRTIIADVDRSGFRIFEIYCDALRGTANIRALALQSAGQFRHQCLSINYFRFISLRYCSSYRKTDRIKCGEQTNTATMFLRCSRQNYPSLLWRFVSIYANFVLNPKNSKSFASLIRLFKSLKPHLCLSLSNIMKRIVRWIICL